MSEVTNMKKIYDAPMMEVKTFAVKDVITLSGGDKVGSTMTSVDFEDLFIS